MWTTDSEPLLGVRDGKPEPLLNPVYEFCKGCVDPYIYASGLNADWTNSNANTCNGWTSSLDAVNFRNGDKYSTTDYLSDSLTPCDVGEADPFFGPFLTFYCVEQ